MYYTTLETHPCYRPSSTGAATSISLKSKRNWHNLVLCRAGGQSSKTQPPLHIKEEERHGNKVTRRHIICIPGSMLISSASRSFSGRVGPNGDLPTPLLTVYIPSEVQYLAIHCASMGTDKYSQLDAMIGGYASINEAIRDAPDGGVIYITQGVYHERVVLDGPSITLQASPEVSISNLR